MINEKELFRAKALAFNNSIRAMDGSEKNHFPTAIYGDDYNGLRQNVLRAYPELVSFMPPAAQTEYEFNQTSQRYSEIDTFCEQIYQLLSTMKEECEQIGAGDAE